MSAGILPAGVVEAIDKRRRSFLWTGEETCNGGQCKLAWTEVCTPKKFGGLGVLSLQAQNAALLSKFLTKMHSTSSAPWASWFRRNYGWSASRDLGDHHYLDTPIWKDIVAGLNTFRDISSVTIGNGCDTAFWSDLWFEPSPLNLRFPHLFSHTTRPNISVATALSSSLSLSLVPRLTEVAMTELRTLTTALGSVVLRLDVPDLRVSRLTNNLLTNKNFYSSFFSNLQLDDIATKVWRSAAPLKCKIFCWLARKKRLPTNERRFRHHLGTSATCLSCPGDEDTDHLLLHCPRASEIWRFFHRDFDDHDYATFPDFWLLRCRTYEETTINTAIAWSIWKRRNALTFNGVIEDISMVAQRCLEDIRLWAFRCTTPASSHLLNSWCNG
jgi:hypothetical protein